MVCDGGAVLSDPCFLWIYLSFMYHRKTLIKYYSTYWNKHHFLYYNIFYNIFPIAVSGVIPACLSAHSLKDVLHAGDIPPIHFSSSDSRTNGFLWLSPVAISELSLAWLSSAPSPKKKTVDVRCFWFILHSKISTAVPDTLLNLAFSDCLLKEPNFRLCKCCLSPGKNTGNVSS